MVIHKANAGLGRYRRPSRAVRPEVAALASQFGLLAVVWASFVLALVDLIGWRDTAGLAIVVICGVSAPVYTALLVVLYRRARSRNV